MLAYSDDGCVAGARADVRGDYCLTAPPGTYWLRATAAGADVGYARVRLTQGSVRQDVRSVVEVIELPPVEVRGDHRMQG